MSMAARGVYPVGRPTGVCAATGRRLEPGDGFFAALVEHEDGTLERQDFGVEAWEKGARPKARLFGSWRGVMPSADAGPKFRLDDGELSELFEHLSGAEGERAVGLRYVLALLLVRRRVLRYEGTSEGRVWVRRPGEEERIGVIDPGLDEEQLAAVAEQLGEGMADR
jgi:hypothetical protein